MDSILPAGGEPPLGAHLVVARLFYSHHGIYAGNGRVIHYRLRVEEVSLAAFARGRGVRVRRETTRFDRHEVVARARSRLGESGYRLLTNNCEHFCAWALHGVSHSEQVERVVGALRLNQRMNEVRT